MKIISVKKLEDCFDGSLISEVQLDMPISHEFIESLCSKASGKCQYLKEFARPFFKADFIDLFMIEGIMGATTARVVIYRKNSDKELRSLKEILKSC
jgi:hypothetical protein